MPLVFESAATRLALFGARRGWGPIGVFHRRVGAYHRRPLTDPFPLAAFSNVSVELGVLVKAPAMPRTTTTTITVATVIRKLSAIRRETQRNGQDRRRRPRRNGSIREQTFYAVTSIGFGGAREVSRQLEAQQPTPGRVRPGARQLSLMRGPCPARIVNE